MFLERQQKILDIIAQIDSIKVSDLLKVIPASPATVRRDLVTLEKRGLISRSHGYVLNPNYDSKMISVLPYMQRRTIANVNKTAIAQKAKELIGHSKTIFLDSGSTVIELAKLLIKEKYTIVTNSLDVFLILGGTQNRLLCCGGLFFPEDNCFLGKDAIKFNSQIEVDIAFLGTTGARGLDGLATSSTFHYDFKKSVIDVSKRSYAVFDAEKFESSNLYVFAGYTDVTGIVTTVPKAGSKAVGLLKQIREMGVEVYLAETIQE